MIAFNSLYHKKHQFVITFLGEYDFFENTAYTYFIITYDEKMSIVLKCFLLIFYINVTIISKNSVAPLFKILYYML